MGSESIDTGDHVLHRPTGETWVVACVQGEHLSWCGYPEGRAALSDCDLVRKAGPEERRNLLADMARMDGSDHRGRYARETLKRETGNV